MLTGAGRAGAGRTGAGRAGGSVAGFPHASKQKQKNTKKSQKVLK